MIETVERRTTEVAELCRRFGVRRLDLFGSAATGRFDEATSDLDFVADFADPPVPGHAFRAIDLAEALKALFGRRVDLVNERSIRNPYVRLVVDAQRQPVSDERGPSTTTKGDPALLALARQIAKTVRENTKIDWSVRESVRADMRRSVRRVLRRLGYPPERTDGATDLVVQQAELLTAEAA